MKSALKDIMVRDEKLASQNMVLEALGSDTQEEIKVITLASSTFTIYSMNLHIFEGFYVKAPQTSLILLKIG